VSGAQHLDEALERVVRLRERLLAEVDAPGRAERLALVFESGGGDCLILGVTGSDTPTGVGGEDL